MNADTNRNRQASDELLGMGKDEAIMATTNFAVGLNVFGARRIRRGRWLRLLTALSGVMLLALQIAPALAGGSTVARMDPTELSHLLGKEDTGYDLIGAQVASRAGADAVVAAPANLAGVSSAAALDTSSRSQILRDAVEQLENAQADPGDERPQGDAPVVGEPADDAGEEQPAGDGANGELESSAAGDELTLVLRDEFTSADTSLWTGEVGGHEALVSEEDGGWYVMLVAPNSTLPVIATGELAIGDGLIMTDAGFYGDGAGQVGLIGRAALDYSSYYFCGADSSGGAGCYLFEAGQWQTLFTLQPGEVTRYQLDRLVLDIVGDSLTFVVNDTVVGSLSGAGMTGSAWGVATVCIEGLCAGDFDYLDVYAYAAAGDTSSGDEVPTTVLIETSFDAEPGDSFYFGAGEWGFAELFEGMYVVGMEPGWHFPNAIGGSESVNDGIITADVSFDGTGAFGLIARMSTSADGTSNYYVCWLNSYAFANCHVVVDDVWYDIPGSEGVEVQLQDINRLSMAIIGDQLAFAVNSQPVTNAVDATLAAGAMGFYHEAFADGPYFDSYIDYLTVELLGGEARGGAGATIASELDENDLGLYVDQGEWGMTGFYEGFYVTELAAGWWFPNTLADTAFIQDGAMTLVVAFDGEGATGLVARAQYGDAGMSYYVCWLNSDAYAGCHLVIDGAWYELAVTEGPVQIADFNELSMAVSGAQIGFAVNGQLVIEVVDETLASGDWGFFTEAYAYGDSQSFVTYVDTITIEAFTG